mgnify:CR=1 FL=1
MRKAFIDNGNTTHGGVAISERLHKELGLKFKRRQKITLNTAAKGGKLNVLGTSRPILVKFDGINTKFKICPLVLADLADDINVGTDFLQTHRFTLSFDPMGTKLKNATGSSQLISCLSTADNREGRLGTRSEGLRDTKRERSIGKVKNAPGSPVTCIEDAILKPGRLTFVKIPKMKVPGNILVTPVDEESIKCVQAVSAVYYDPGKIALLNISDAAQKLKKGAIIASFSRTRIASDIMEVAEDDDTAFTELRQKLKLDDNDLLTRNPHIKAQLLEIIKNYQHVFADPESEVGETDLVEFDIEVKPGTQPYRSKVRPLNPTMRESLRKQLDDWTKEDVIEPSNSPWASALVPALKKDGKIRWAIDYRRLNDVTIADSYPLPSISENLEKLQGSKVFTALDAASAYHSIRVKEHCRPYLAFTTPYGLYQMKRMPFGPRNAPATYARFIELALQKLRSPYIICYLDDIIVHTRDLEHHLEEVRKTLEMHMEAGIKLRASKCEFFKEDINYLGFRITPKGIRMRDDYIERIVNWPQPTTVKALNTYLGFIGYYRSFIPKFAKWTKDMNSQRKSLKLHWTEKMDQNFYKLREAFRSSPIRAYPQYDTDEPFRLTLDFSKDNLAAILSQKQEGRERLIAASGRNCTPYERNYGSTKGELAALIYGLRCYEHILRFKEFEVYTDASALKYLKNIKKPRGIWFRWLQEACSFQMKVFHKPGRLNTNADSFSRCGHLPPASEDDVKEQEEYIECVGSISNGKITINALEQENDGSEILDGEVVKESQREDRVLKQVRDWLTTGHQPTKEELRGQDEETQAYAQILGALHDDEGTLVYRYRSTKGDLQQEMRRILIPERLRQTVFYHVHRHLSAGHFGQEATVCRAVPRFFWPGMSSYLKAQVRSCADCITKIKKCNQRDTVHYPQKSGYPGERLSIDLVGPLPETATVEKNRYIMTVQCMFSKFVQCFPLPNKEAETCANVLIERFICNYGCPAEIHTDRGGEFHNRLWRDLLDRLEIKKTTTPPYNPSSNPVERFHRTLNQIFTTYLRRDDPNWYKYLPMATLAYNTKRHNTTLVTPYEAWFGRKCKLPIDLILPTPQRRYETVQESVRETMGRFGAMYDYMRRNHSAMFDRNAKLYTGNLDNFKDGDIVWYFATMKVPGKPKKITDNWIGPFKVVGRVAPVLIRVKPADYEGPEKLVHVTRLRPYVGPKDSRKGRIPANLELEDEGDELAEEIHADEDNERWITEDLRNPPSIPIRMEEPLDDIVDRIPKKDLRMDEPTDEFNNDTSIPKKPGRPPKKAVHFETDAPPKIDDEFTDQDDATGNVQDQDMMEPGSSKRPRESSGDEGDDESTSRAHKRREVARERKRDPGGESIPLQEQPKRVRMASEHPAFLGRKLVDNVTQKLRTAYRDANELLSPDEATTTDNDSDIGSIGKFGSRGKQSTQRDSALSAYYDVRSTSGPQVLRAGCIMSVGLQLRPTQHFDYILLESRPGLADKGILTLPTVLDLTKGGSRQAYLKNITTSDYVIHKNQRISIAIPLTNE